MNRGYYKHVDGGIYFLIMIAKDAETDADVAVYEHVWPFSRQDYVRSLSEFKLRFTEITGDEVMTHLAKSFEETAQARDLIMLSKRRRRVKEGKKV